MYIILCHAFIFHIDYWQKNIILLNHLLYENHVFLKSNYLFIYV